MNMSDFQKLMVVLLEEKFRENKNLDEVFSDLQEHFDSIFNQFATVNGWGEWGDGNWREETACSLCGSSVPGICEHAKNPNRVVLRGMAAVEAQHAAESR